MDSIRFAAGLTAVLWVALSASTAGAFFHLWDFTEFFSNADGTVQFIEMGTSAGSEDQALQQTMTLRSTSTPQTFTFNHNLVPATTTNKRILIATTGFESLPGLPTMAPLLTPDYIIPANFFNPAGDTIRFCQNSCAGALQLDIRTFASGVLPTDGVMSLNFSGATVTTTTNTPKNFAGTTGSVDLTPPPHEPTGDFNGDLIVDAADYTVWRNHFGEADETNINDAGNGMGGVDEEDYNVWMQFYGTELEPPAGGGGSSTVPEPAVACLALSGLVALLIRRRR